MEILESENCRQIYLFHEKPEHVVLSSNCFDKLKAAEKRGQQVFFARLVPKCGTISRIMTQSSQ